MSRDLENYSREYERMPFEPIQAAYRRRRVMEAVRQYEPSRLLEVGCGLKPLFVDLPGVACCVVEPARVFAQGARQLAEGSPHVEIIESTIERAALGVHRFDLVVVSSVLHEVPDPQAMLKAVVKAATPDTVIHVNVPNSHSLHRLLAVAMGIIPEPSSTSELQRTMQQRTFYDRSRFHDELERGGVNRA